MPVKYILVVVCVLALGITVKSQVPGYLGARMSVGYELNQSLNPIAYSYDLADDFKLGFGQVHNLSIDYALKERFSLGAKLGYSFRSFSTEKTVIAEKSYDYPDYTELKVPYNKFYIRDFSLGVYMKIFRAGFSAPVGSYWDFGVDYHIMNAKDYLTHIDFSSIDLDRDSLVTQTSMLNVRLKKGLTRPITDVLVLDLGFYLGASFSYEGYNTEGRLGDFQSESFSIVAKNVVTMNSLVGISIGVRLIK